MKACCRCALLFVVGVFTVSPSDAATNTDLVRQLNRAFVDVARNVSPSVVVITATQRPVFVDTDVGGEPDQSDPLDFWRRFHPQFEDDEPFQGQGSGVIIRKNGYILTNRHVVEDADRIDVRLLDGRTFRARLQGVDRQSDIAVIRIDAVDLPVARFGDSSAVQVGEFAIAIGAPFNLDYSVTFGHVSAISRGNIIPSFMGGHIMDQDFIQTDANINPGNSGGPLVNMDGEVIGINTLIRGLRSGIGFAIPSNLAREIAEKLITDGRFTRVWIGLEIHSLRDDPDFRDLVDGIDSGVVIKSVLHNGPAAESDLRPGDVIRSVDKIKVATPQELRSAIRGKPAGKPLQLDVFRYGKNLTVALEPAEYPEPAVGPAPERSPRQEPAAENFGIKARTLDSGAAAQFGVTERKGVVVTAVSPRTPAANKGIRRGDVIIAVSRQPIASESEFTNALSRAQGKAVLLELISEGNPTFEVLKHRAE